MKRETEKKVPVTTTQTVPNRDTLFIKGTDGDTPALNLAKIAKALVAGGVNGANVFKDYAKAQGLPECLTPGLTEVRATIQNVAKEVQDGDLSSIEVTLASQAFALDAMFTNMARVAAGQFHRVDHLEICMRLALKAQDQSRKTLQALVEIRQPKQQTVFAKQANIANGPQQVNNGTLQQEPGNPTTSSRNSDEPQQIELLNPHEENNRMDARAASTTSGGDQTMATVEPVHRSPHDRREKNSRKKCL